MLKKLWKWIFIISILWGIFSSIPHKVLSQSNIKIVNTVNWSSNGVELAVGYNGGLVQIIDTLKGQEIFSSTYFDLFRTLAWSPTEPNLLAIGGMHVEKSQSEVVILNMTTKEIKSIFATEDSISAIAWSPDGSKLGIVKAPITISYTSRNELQIWDVKLVQMLSNIPSPSAEDNITAIAWSPDGTRIAGAITNQSIIVWNILTDKESLVLSGHKDVIISVDWSPDGTQIASTGSISDDTVRIWDASSGQSIMTFQAHFATVKWSPDGQELALAEYQKVRILNVKTGAEVLNIATSDLENTLDYSPLGGRLAFGGAEGKFSSTPLYSFSNGAAEIIAATSSNKKLLSITQSCNIDTSLKASLTAQISANKLQAFTAEVSALTDAQIPPGCKADLLAVAAALLAKAQ